MSQEHTILVCAAVLFLLGAISWQLARIEHHMRQGGEGAKRAEQRYDQYIEVVRQSREDTVETHRLQTESNQLMRELTEALRQKEISN